MFYNNYIFLLFIIKNRTLRILLPASFPSFITLFFHLITFQLLFLLLNLLISQQWLGLTILVIDLIDYTGALIKIIKPIMKIESVLRSPLVMAAFQNCVAAAACFVSVLANFIIFIKFRIWNSF